MARSRTKTIKVDALARVEGEGAMTLRIRDGRVAGVELRIYEPPRFFEAFLQGRDWTEAPDITARICGICPVAYQMSAVHAMEDLAGVRLPEPIRALRRLLYCGEWIESHVLHIYLLHAPDFLGYPDAIRLAKDHPAEVERGLQLKKAGNEIVELVGGRAVHPVNVRLGGFYRIPARAEFARLAERLRWARDAAAETVRWTAKLPMPDFEQDYTFVALRHPDEYPFNEGRIVSSAGLDIAASEFDDHFEERHVEHSNALHCALKTGGHYMVGPLARWALNFDRLPERVRAAAGEVGVARAVRNPFQSIVVRALEVLFACEEALGILDGFEPPDAPFVPMEPRAGVGHGATEAPRGLLYHRYETDAEGTITKSVIVPPTSQNQPRIEEDLAAFAAPRLDLDDTTLRDQCEQAIRNYDPCISCATHFLKLTVDRG